MRLRSLIQVNPPKSQVAHLPMETEVTFAPMEALEDGLGGLDTSNIKTIAEVGAGSYSFFAEGDVLLAKVTPCFENGKKAIASGLVNGIGFASSEVHVVRPDVRRLHTPYLKYLFSSEDFRAACMASMTGAGGLRRVSEDAILNYHLPVTDIATQEAIASFLDRETAGIDQLIEKKQRALSVLSEKRRSAALQCLSDGLAGFDWVPSKQSIMFRLRNSDWIELRVKGAVSFMTSGSRGWSELLETEGEIFIQSGNIGRRMDLDLENPQRVQPQTGAEADRTLVRAGDVLVCITGGRTGAVGYVRGIGERAYINQHVCLLRARSQVILPELLAHILWSEIGQKQIELCQYGIKQGLGFSEVANLKIPVPPKDIQSEILRAINSLVSRIDASSDLIELSLVRLREFRSALITAAVTGQVDLTTWGKRGSTDRRLEMIETELTGQVRAERQEALA